MNLSLYDTMTRAKRPFVPANPARVTMYVCGPTVYNFAHIGNARPVVVFDVLFRLLRHLFGESCVIYAANVTDVDDKINLKAAQEGVSIDVVTDRYLAAYRADMGTLGALPPTVQPRATQTMAEIIDMIGRLIDNKAAYGAEGHVLFDTAACADYGKLSGRSMDEMIAGARVDVAPYKKNAADFVLWKPSKPGEPVWDSPFGPGRPGWHIECSAMIEKTLGLPIDIHGGGNDLIFPHHENEMAQGLCATHQHEYARYWMHNGFLNMGSEKMSKSLGNVVLVHELIERHPGEALRWALLASHYRQPLAWTDETPANAKNALDRLYQAIRDAEQFQLPPSQPHMIKGLLEASGFITALEDDLNTPAAFSALFALTHGIRGLLGVGGMNPGSLQSLSDQVAALKEAGRLLGFLQADPEVWFKGPADDALKARVEALIAERAEARAAKDWARADRIRDELTALNVEVMDGPTGATWRVREKA